MDETLKARLIGATVLVAVAVLLIPELLSGRRAQTPDAATTAAAHGTRTFTIELGGGPATPASAPSPNTVPALPPVPSAAPTTARPDASAAGTATRADAGQTSASAASHASAAATETQPATAGKVAAAARTPVQPASAAGPTLQAGASKPAAAASQAATQVTRPAPPPTATVAAPSSAASIPARGGWAVQVGAFGTAEAANKLVKELQAAGYRAYVSPVSRAGKPLHRVRVGPETEKARADGLATSLRARGLPATVVAND